MITTQESRWHEVYTESPAHVRQAIDDAYTAARKVLAENQIEVANDDRAEAFVAALTRYSVESRS